MNETISRPSSRPAIESVGLKSANIAPLPQQAVRQAEVSRNLQGVNAGMVDFIKQNNPVAEVPVKGGSLAVAEKAGSLVSSDYSRGPTVEATASVVESNIDEIGIKPMTPLLNPERQGFRQDNINGFLAEQNRLNGIPSQNFNQQPAIGNLAPAESTGFSPIRNEAGQQNITTFVPGASLDLNQARYTQPESVQQVGSQENNLNQIPQQDTVKIISELLPNTNTKDQIITNQNEALKELDSGQKLEEATNALAPSPTKTEVVKNNKVAEVISKIPGLSTQQIWQEAAKGGGFFKALKADWDQSFRLIKKPETSQITPEINFLANRQPRVESATTSIPQTRSEISYPQNPDFETARNALAANALERENGQLASPETLKTREQQQTKDITQNLGTKYDEATKIVMIKQLLADLPQSLNSETKENQVETATQNDTIDQVTETVATAEQPSLPQIEASPIAGLLPPARELNPEENLNLPRTQADTIGNLSKKYDEVWKNYLDPKDREFHKAADQKVQELQQYIAPKELYKALNLNFDSSLTPQQEQARFERLLLRTVLQGSIDAEGNLGNINSAKQKTDNLIPSDRDLKTIFETGVRNFTTLEQAKNVKALTTRNFEQKYGADEQFSDLAFGEAFVEQLFSDPKAPYGVSPQMAKVLTSQEYQLNINGQFFTLNDILSYQRQNGIQALMANQDLIKAIAKAVKETLELPQKE